MYRRDGGNENSNSFNMAFWGMARAFDNPLATIININASHTAPLPPPGAAPTGYPFNAGQLEDGHRYPKYPKGPSLAALTSGG
jgi:hypothetical protein